jgi:hypothetical protein
VRSTFGKVLLGVGSFGSLIAIAIFLVLLVTFERISEELLMVLWVLLICFFIVGRLMKKYFDSMVDRGEVDAREQQFWREKARHWGPLAAPTFWWRAIAKPREHSALPENYSAPPK